MKKIMISLLTLMIFSIVGLIIIVNFNNEDFKYTCTVSWRNYDGKIIYEEKVKKGQLPKYSKEEPKRDSDKIADYTFSGWLPEVKTVDGDINYIAKYDVSMKEFGLVASQESGFYDEGFELNLHSTANTTIYYTLDSTTPTINSNVYDGSIKITDNSNTPNKYSNIDNISSLDIYLPTDLVDKCVTVKAIAVDSESNVSDVICKSYFIGYNEKLGYDNMTIISMVCDPAFLFDYEEGIYVTGKLYDEGEKIGYPEEYPANYQEKGREWEKEASFTYFDNDNSFSFSQNIGIRIHGGWSRAFNQKSFNLYARSEYSGSNSFEKPFFDTVTLKTCMLRSGGYRDTFKTKVRDGMNQDLSKIELFSTQDSIPVILFLNGEYWGIYYLQERFTDSYVEEHYKIDEDNVIIVKNDVLDEGIEEDIYLYEELISFFNDNDFTLDSNYEMVHKYIDVYEFAAYMATELYIGNIDWPGNNVAMWRSREITNLPYEDGRWHFMFYDTDDSASMLESKCNYDSDPFLNKNHWKYGPLDNRCILGLMLYKLLYNINFQTIFKEEFERIATTNFSSNNVNNYLNDKIELLSIPMNNFYTRFVSSDEFTYNISYFVKNVEVIKNFYENRYYYMKEYLSKALAEYR